MGKNSSSRPGCPSSRLQGVINHAPTGCRIRLPTTVRLLFAREMAGALLDIGGEALFGVFALEAELL